MSENIIFWFLMCLVLILPIAALHGAERHKKEFMAECLQDKKQYECMALWRK